jgi:hypothetical protein
VFLARPKNLAALTDRPTKFTLDVAAEVLTRIYEGESLHRICASLPDIPAVRRWPQLLSAV